MRFPFSNPASRGALLAAGGLAATLALPVGAAELPFPAQGGEFKPARSLPGDQVHPSLSYGAGGGYLVWQDNGADGDGTGIQAVRLGEDLTPVFAPFKVNAIATGNQDVPRVAKLTGGGAAFVWRDDRDVYVRFLDTQNKFTTASDIQANTDRSGSKEEPTVVAVSDGGALVLWGSRGQDDAGAPAASHRMLQGVYAQRFDANGARIGTEFRLNEATRFNQRSPAAALLDNGQVIVTWVHEDADTLERVNELVSSDPTAAIAQLATVEIRARLLGADLAPLGSEFKINSDNLICANPSVAGATGGGFLVAWTQKDPDAAINSLDIYVRAFAAGGVPQSTAFRVNAMTFGDQFAPRIAGHSGDHVAVWTSLGQDGSREGVYGRFLSAGAVLGEEFRVNTTTISQQIHPAPAADPGGGFCVVWAGFAGSTSFDLFAQRYQQGLPRPPRPFVRALNQAGFSVTWPELGGFPGVHYAVYVDASPEPVVVDGNRWITPEQFSPASAHTFRVGYRFADGRTSPISDPTEARTWGADRNFDGLPDDWQTQHYGIDAAAWARPQADTDQDGASTLQEFLAGTDPTQADSVLRMTIVATPQGPRLAWNTQPGQFYQIEQSSDLESWAALGETRFAPGTEDSIPVGSGPHATYYRVNLVR